MDDINDNLNNLRDARWGNLVKITVPWQIGHVVAIGAADGGFENGDPVTFAAGLATYPIIGIYLWTCARGDGRGVHDRLAGTVVRRVAPVPESG